MAAVGRETVKVIRVPSLTVVDEGDMATAVGATLVRVTVLEVGLPREMPAVGLLRVTVKVSFDSEPLSNNVGTLKVFESSSAAKAQGAAGGGVVAAGGGGSGGGGVVDGPGGTGGGAGDGESDHGALGHRGGSGGEDHRGGGVIGGDGHRGAGEGAELGVAGRGREGHGERFGAFRVRMSSLMGIEIVFSNSPARNVRSPLEAV